MSRETEPEPPPPDPARPGAGELAILGAIVVGFVAVALAVVSKGAPLGHDEAVYALRTRTMVDGASAAYFWNDFRAPGFPALLTTVFRIRGTEPLLRLAVAGFGGVLVVVTWWFGRGLFGRLAGLVAAAGVSSTPAVVASSTAIWPDVPGAALGLLAVAIVYQTTRGDSASWWALAAAPVALLATAVRFGAPLPMAIAVVAILVFNRRAVLARPLPVGATAIATGAGVAIMLFTSWVFGTADAPYASIRTLQQANDFPLYQGLVDYGQQASFLAFTTSGVVLALGMAIGLVAARGDRDALARVRLVTVVGAATFAAIAITLHGEYRYLMPVYPFAWILAGYGLVRLGRQLPASMRRVAVGVVALALAFGAVASGDEEASKTLDRFRPLRAAGRLIEAEAEDGSCGVVTSYVPQLSWYTGCVTRDFELDRVVLDSPSFAGDATRFMVLVAEGKRQPEGELLAAYLAEAGDPPATVGEVSDGALGFVEIYRLSSR